MKQKPKILSILLAALLLFLPGCDGGGAETAEEAASEVSIRPTVTEADPVTAVNEIYEALPDAQTRELTNYELTQNFPDLDPESLISYTGRLSSPDGGLADVVFFEPAEGERDAAREALHLYQEQRIREFENYDILGAFQIAQDAIVIDQGDFVILLMLAEEQVEAAREIIDQYIPL
jgi:hypothetical protein